MIHRPSRLALGLLFVALVPTLSEAKPPVYEKKHRTEYKPATKPTATIHPQPKATYPSPVKSIAKEHLQDVKNAKPLTKAQKRDLLRRKGIDVPNSEIGKATTISVRKPWFNAATHLSFQGLTMVQPSVGRGTAVIGQVNSRGNGDDAPRSSSSRSTTFELPNTPAPAIGPISPSPGSRGAPASSGPVRGRNFATVRFKAARSKSYIVDCIASGSEQLHAEVISGQEIVGRKSARADEHFELLVSAGRRRSVRIDLFSSSAWTLRECTITPVG